MEPLMEFAINLYLLQFVNFTSRNMSHSVQIQHYSSVGVEALAGVLAIVISVTFVAVQFSSQEYSKRLMDYFINSVIFKFLIGVYLIGIIFNMFMLNYQFEDPNIDNRMRELSIILTGVCFVSLVPYFYITAHILQPEYLIKNILKRVDEKYLKSIHKKWIKDRFPPVPEDDRVLAAITDIISKAIESNDRIIITNGLSKMYDCFNKKNNNLYLFSISEVDELKNGLNSGLVTEDLRNVFETKRLPLSKTASLDKEKEGVWLLINEKKIYIVRSEDEKLNIYNNTITAYFLKHFLDIAKIAIINSDDHTITQIVNFFENMIMTYLFSIGDVEELEDKLNSGLVTEDLRKVFEEKGLPLPKNVEKKREDLWVLINDKIIYTITKEERRLNICQISYEKTYQVLELLYEVIRDSLNKKLMAPTKIFMVEKFIALVKFSKKLGILNKLINLDILIHLGILTADQNDLDDTTTIKLLTVLCDFKEIDGFTDVSERAIQNKREDATEAAINMLIDIEEIARAIAIILQATENQLNVHPACEKLGDLSSKKTLKDKDLHLYVLENNDTCDCIINEYDSNKVILEINRCFINTATDLGNSKIQSYCKKTRSNIERGHLELPVCSITFSYLETAIKLITGKDVVMLKRPLEWNEKGFCKLTFTLQKKTS
jgi:hypothetical protein